MASKRKLETNPEWTAKRAYYSELNMLPVHEAAIAAPLSAVERSLQRYKIRNRPPLPATRQDLVIQPEHRMTIDGRRLLLVDDGVADDRMLIFGTNENITR